MKALTSKQNNFVNEYLVDSNATQAAIRAGYSSRCAREIGCENLAKPYIKSQIELEQKKRQLACEYSFNMKLRLLWEIVQEAYEAKKYMVVIRAIAEMNKMQGDYAPTKTENSNAMTFEAWLKLLK